MKKNFIYTVLMVIGGSFYSQAQEPYFIPMNGNFPESATAIASMDVESADVDGDGDLDLVIAGEFRRNLLFFNDGDGVFTEDPSRLFPEKNINDGFPGEDSEDIIFSDFDLDGDLDVFFASEDSNFHELLINDGSGNFSFITYEFPPSTGNAAAALDLNNDQYPDIIIGNNGQNNVYINNQDLTFTQDNSRWPVNSEGTQDLKLIDLDNDTDLDIVEGIDSGTNNILINANGFFTEENNRLPSHPFTLETRKVVLGDSNGDSFTDIFVATVNFTNGNTQNRLYVNDGNGFFNDATTNALPVSFQSTLDAVFIDYDYDGDLDLISTDFQNPSNPNYHAYENDGTGIFTDVTQDVFQAFSFNSGVGIHAGDFNGDLYPDLYFSNYQEADDLLFFSEDALSTIEFESLNKFKAYPNPVINTFIIDADLSSTYSNLGVRVYDVSGKAVNESFGIEPINNHLFVELNISYLNSGVYFYSVFNGTQQLFNGKLIKQ